MADNERFWLQRSNRRRRLRFFSKDSVDRGNIFPFLKYWTPVFENTGEINALNSDS
jgi:hypothetical protein